MSKTYRLDRQDEMIATAYGQLRPAILHYVLKRIGRDHADDAEDLVQDVFCQLLSYDVILDEDRLTGLVYKVARNLVIDYLRHHAYWEAARAYFQHHISGMSRCTEEQLTLNELERLEMRAVARMPEKKARVYYLYVHEGQPVQEISRLFGISRRTVENHIFRARYDLHRIINAS